MSLRTLALSGLAASLCLVPARAVSPPADPPGPSSPSSMARASTGWHGMPHFDPHKLRRHERRGAVQEARRVDHEDAKKHSSVENGQLVNDGLGHYATTEKDYGDFELLIEYKTVAWPTPVFTSGGAHKCRSGTRPGKSKWDRGANKGSGGLFNNKRRGPRPRPADAGRQALWRVEQPPYPPGRQARQFI